ncbi:MAG: septum formation initiator family protein [Acidimicrobiia bacterium]
MSTLAPPRRPTWLLVPATVLLVGLAMVTNVIPFRQIVEQRTQVSEAEARLDALVEENRLLESQVEALNTPAEIERLAREKLGYVREGETAYVVLEPESSGPAATDRMAAGSGSVDERAWWERLWDFVTGRDLAGGR